MPNGKAKTKTLRSVNYTYWECYGNDCYDNDFRKTFHKALCDLEVGVDFTIKLQ